MFLEGHPFWKGGGLLWCEPDVHQFFPIVHPSPIHPFVPIILVRHGIEPILFYSLSLQPGRYRLNLFFHMLCVTVLIFNIYL